MPHSLVVNIRFQECDVYIGRKKSGMHYGNPWSHLPLAHCLLVASREESIRNFDDWINERAWPDVEPERRAWILRNLDALVEKRLGCFCAPQSCHGSCYVNLLENKSAKYDEFLKSCGIE